MNIFCYRPVVWKILHHAHISINIKFNFNIHMPCPVPLIQFGNIVKFPEDLVELPSQSEAKQEIGIFNKRIVIQNSDQQEPLKFADMEQKFQDLQNSIDNGEIPHNVKQIVHRNVVDRFKTLRSEVHKSDPNIYGSKVDIIDGNEMRYMSEVSELIVKHVDGVYSNQILQIKKQNQQWGKDAYNCDQIADRLSLKCVELIDKPVRWKKYKYNISKLNQCIENKEYYQAENFKNLMLGVQDSIEQKLQNENKQLKNDKQILNNQIASLNNDKQNLNNEISNLHARFDKLEKINEKLSKENHDVRAFNEKLSKENNDVRAFNEKLSKENEDFKAWITKLQNENDKLKKEDWKKSRKIDQLNSKLNGVQNALDEDGNLEEENLKEEK